MKIFSYFRLLLVMLALFYPLNAEQEVGIVRDTSFIQQDLEETLRLRLVEALGPLSQYDLIAIEPYNRFPRATVLKSDGKDHKIISCDILRTDDGRIEERKVSREDYLSITSKATDLFQDAKSGKLLKVIPPQKYQSTRVFVFIRAKDRQKSGWRSLKIILDEDASPAVFSFFKALSGKKDFSLKPSVDPWSTEKELE